MKAGNMKIAAVTAVAVLLCVGFTYVAYPEQDDGLFGSPWINTTCAGNLPAERPSAQDDLYTWANYDWLSSADVLSNRDYVYRIGESERVVFDRFAGLITSDVPTTEGRLLKSLMDLVTDTEARDSVGLGQVPGYLEALVSVDSREEMEAILAEIGFLTPLCKLTVERFDGYDHDFVNVNPASIIDGLYIYGTDMEDGFTDALCNMMEVFGFDREMSENIVEQAIGAEIVLADASNGNRELFTETDLPGFPLWEYFRSQGMEAGEKVVIDAGWVKAMSALAEEDLRSLSCLAAVFVAFQAASLLDERAWDAAEAVWEAVGIGTDQYGSVDNGATMCLNHIPSAAAGLYSDLMVSDHTRQRLTGIVESAKEVYAGMLSSCEWLDGSTLSVALEKLDRMRLIVAESTWARDFSGLGGGYDGLLDTVAAYRTFTNEQMFFGARSGHIEEEYFAAVYFWNINLFYSVGNVLTILPAILVEPLYSDSMSDGEVMSSIGFLICHELSHAFDPSSSRYDADGNVADWWSPEAREEYDKRVAAVKDTMSGFEILPGIFLDADRTVDETVADLCAVQCIMIMAPDIDGFDHRRFFTGIAESMAAVGTYEFMLYVHYTDGHPPNNFRINFISQQLPQFHEAFGVTPGDGMWLDPEDRILIW